MAKSLKKRGAGKTRKNKKNIAKRLKRIQENHRILKSLEAEFKK